MRGQKTQPDRKKKYICMYKSIDKIDVPLQFEWDEAKRHSNIEKHGIDFYDAISIFEQFCVLSSLSFSQERRFKAIGMLGAKEIALIFTIRGKFTRLISARRARLNERKEYHARNLRGSAIH
jgi:uncharacterized DUF497 family protein